MFQSLTNSFYNFYNLSPLCKTQDITEYSILYKTGDNLIIIEEAEYEQITKQIKNQKSRILTNFFKVCLQKKKKKTN